MLIRLWWKEARVFGPVWLILVAAAGLLQWFLLSGRSGDFRDGSLTVTALSWSVLYAFAVASGAFSGERESKTLGFLDALPVSRLTLWLGKAGFALISTAGLVLMLIGLASLGTTHRNVSGENSWAEIFGSFFPLILGGLGWGLLWSALSRNTLLAAVMAIVSLASTSLPTLDRTTEWLSRQQDWEIRPRMVIPLFALAASLIALTWRPSWKWSMDWNPTIVRASRPVGIRTSSTALSLFWQVIREGWPTAFLVAFLSLLIPVLCWYDVARLEGLTPLLLATLATVVAGVSVFGSENAIGSRRFLVHHGVNPIAVWGCRLAAWGFFMAAILALMIAMIRSIPLGLHPLGNPIFDKTSATSEHLMMTGCSMFNAFAVGLVCGMAIRRRITAALAGTMVLVPLIPMQLGLLALNMIPTWSLVLIPSVLMTISAAWAGDWLLEPEGFRRYLRLGLLIVVPFGLLGGTYTSYRAFGVPDAPPVAIAANEFPNIPDDQNAASLYRRAIDLIPSNQRSGLYQSNTATGSLASIIDFHTAPAGLSMTEVLVKNQAVIEQTKRAAAMPAVAFESPDRMVFGAYSWDLYRDLRALNLLLAIEARERLKNGGIAGAWDDILDQFRMANQLVGATPTIWATELSTQFHARAVNQAFTWLSDSRQTPETLRKALADLKALSELPDMSRCLRFESLLIERACDLSTDELTERMFQSEGRKNATSTEYLGTSWVMTPSWERQRARRVCRAIVAGELPIVTADPWNRAVLTTRTPNQRDPKYQGSLLAQGLLPTIQYPEETLDKEKVNRRALIQLVALVLWKLEHEGKDAVKLEDLVPGLLEKLPVDPYSGKPFGYVATREMVGSLEIRPLNHLYPIDQWPKGNDHLHLLYSFGTDLKDDLGRKSFGLGHPTRSGDLIFAIP